jgi:Flp pilus assembly protein protease CpaA
MSSLSHFFQANLWPLWLGWSVLGAASVWNFLTNRVPNWLTVSATLAAWLVAGALVSTGIVTTAGGGITSSLLSAIGPLVVLLPFWIQGRIPGGCVKAQMAFGAWTGCALAAGPAFATTLIATICGAGLTIILLQLHIYWVSSEPETGSVIEQYAVVPQRMFPCQLTLAIGSTLGLLLVFGLGVV